MSLWQSLTEKASALSFLTGEKGAAFMGERESAPQSPFADSLNIPRLHRLLPYESYDAQHQLFYNKGTTGFILGGSPLVGASLKDQGQIADFLKQEQFLPEGTTGFILGGSPLVGASLKDQGQIADFLKQEQFLPEGTAVQFLLFASPRIQHWFDHWLSHREEELFQKLGKRRALFLQEKAFEDALGHVVRDFKVIISYTVPGLRTELVDIDRLKDVRRSLKGALEGMGMSLFSFGAQDLLDSVADLLNFEETTTPEQLVWNPEESLSRQIADSRQSWTVERDHVCVREGELLIKSFVPQSCPKEWGLPYMDRFLGDSLDPTHSLPCPYLLHYSFFVESRQDWKKGKIKTKRESLEKSLQNRMTKWLPGLEEQYQEHVEAARQLQQGERSILSHFSMTTFCRPSLVSEMEMSIKRIWNSVGWHLYPARYDHLGIFLSSLPMMSLSASSQKMKFFTSYQGCLMDMNTLGKAKRTITKEAQNMLPILGEWKGQSTPGVILTGRRGQLFFWSPFGKMLVPSADMQTNHDYNVCIAGTMGSGKSVLMNEMMTTVLGIGGRVIVLDKGRSFKHACLLLGGQHMEFSITSPVSLNPFTHIPEGTSESEESDRKEMLALINPIVQMMASPLIGTTDAQDNHIAKAIQKVWEKKKSTSCLNDVADYLSTHEDSDARDVGHLLYQFTQEGDYGCFFNEPANVDLSSRLVVIETDDLRNHAKLLPVIVQMLIIQVNQMIAKSDRSKPFMIMIDEAWELLKGKKTGDFIEQAARTVRKYKGSLVLATQSTKDYFRDECPGATMAWENSAWKCILSQDDGAIHEMKNIKALQALVEDDYLETLLLSLRPHPPHFSEVAIFGKGIKGVVGRLRLDPFARLLYSSNPEDFRTITSLVKQGLSLQDAIEEVASRQEKGGKK